MWERLNETVEGETGFRAAGTLLAQQAMRHKTSKPDYVRDFWLTVVLNLTGFVAIHAGVLARWLHWPG